MKFDIKNVYGSVIFTADIDCADDTEYSIKLGLAVKIALKAGANLADAYLAGANLARANLAGAKGLGKKPTQTVILPEGDLIVYKKLKEGVAKLLIPSDAKRSNATGRKCRAEYAKVRELPEGIIEGSSQYKSDFKYRVGEIVRPDYFDPDWKNECAGGIHFFITKEEAENYS